MVRQGFRALLDAEPDLSVVGDAADGKAAVAGVLETRPHVVLLDIRMPVMNGLEAAAEIMRRRIQPEPRLLMLTTFDVDDYVYEALRLGASGFMLKDAPAAELTRAVRVVAAGDALLAPAITRRFIEEVTRNRRPASRQTRALDTLTVREREVLELIARGMSNAEIAEHLVVAEQTVKTHVGRVLAKLQLRDRAQAVVLAYEAGVVRPA